MNELSKLLEYHKEIADIQYTINLLRWDLKISTPKKSQEDLIKLITFYEGKLFELQTSDKYGSLLSSVIQNRDFLDITEPERRYICNLLRHYKENVKVPIEFYTSYTELKNKSNIIWQKAKKQNDYELFKPYLKDIIEMTKQYYSFIDCNNTNLYDVMLNRYETGMTSEVIDRLFNELKQRLLPLIPKESKRKYSKTIKYSEKELMDCAQYLLEYIGFDMDRGLLGIFPHGFTEKMSRNDIRIGFKVTTDPYDFVTTIIHEGGHGIFEQNISENLSRYENTVVDNLYALHESQSRFYENILGRNINFWIPIYDEISKKLRLNIPLSEFINNLNDIRPNLIRTEADELTYCMHIILRYEIERDLFSGKISVDDLPDIWNDKVKNYLGLSVYDYSNGILQDIHWSEGSFGYFPSYLLGIIYDGMLMDIIEKDLGNIDELLKNGKIKDITNYLINSIYKNGGAYTSSELLYRLCEKEITIEPIARYFEKKYSLKNRIYDL